MVGMKNITINLPDRYDDVLQKFIVLKLVASRSEAIRLAIRTFLEKEVNLNDLIKDFCRR